MTSETRQEFVGRSQPRMWAIVVLALAAALLIYVGIESLSPDFNVKGRGAFLNEMPIWFRGTFFVGLAATCLGLGALQLWRKLSRQIEVQADPKGITSHLFWGKGQLRWADIVALERKGNWLFVRGTDPNAKPKKLVIDTT